MQIWKVNPESDLAMLSSVRAQLDDLVLRILGIADDYATTPDSQIAAELFNAERSLRGATRCVDRASSFLAR